MARTPGTTSFFGKIKSIRDFKESYIEHIAANIEEALRIKQDHLKNGSENLKAGAANFYVSEWNKIEKEYRKATPKDFVKKPSPSEEQKEKEKKAGLKHLGGSGLISTTFPGEATGTDD